MARAFRKLDRDSVGLVPRDQWLQMVGQFAGGTKQEQIDFLFKTFDTNSNGELEMDEVRAMQGSVAVIRRSTRPSRCVCRCGWRI